MTIDYKTKDGKLQYYINREAAQVSVLSSGKIDKYDFLQAEKYYHMSKVEQQNKLSLHILHLVKHLGNKCKQMKIKE